MKACPYCGKEYPDDAIVCEIDQNALIHFQPKPPTNPQNLKASQKQARPITGWRILSSAGFAILAGLFGLGLTWLAVGITAGIRFKTFDEKIVFAAKCMPIMIGGGIIGFVIGLIAVLKVAKGDPKTEIEIEKKYIGTRGRMKTEVRTKIYFGAPIFVMALLSPFLEKLLDKLGTQAGVYVALGIALVIIALSLMMYDRIPSKYIIPIGIIGWLLTLSMVVWFEFLRPGAF